LHSTADCCRALFLNTTLDRTYLTPEMTGARFSVECRYIPKTQLMPDEAARDFYPLG
jgi:hypothetical protein